MMGTVLSLFASGTSPAADLGVAAKKLVIVDKLAAAGKAKAVFVASDPAVTKGSGTDPSTISLELFFGYQGVGGPASGTFSIPAGASDGTTGWTANQDSVAKFVNKSAPAGSTGVKVSTVKPGNLLKVVGKTRGDLPIDLITAGAPVTDVCVAAIVTNGAETTRLCTRFPADLVSFGSIAQDTGRKLVVRNGLPDVNCLACSAGLPTTTTSTTSTSITSSSASTSSSSTTSTSTSIPASTSSSSSTSTSTTTSTTIPALCGNGVVNAGETCDDGNQSDNDGCPANCFIAACTPVAATVRQVTVSFTPPAGVAVAALTLLMNYPEQKVFMPPAGPQATIGAANFVPLYPSSEVLIRGADLAPAGSTGSGHAVRGLVADSTAVPPGSIFQLKFQDCQGAAAPIPGEFNCRVLDATDPFTNQVNGVVCSVTLP
jgi:cysteine-rich repeat protein